MVEAPTFFSVIIPTHNRLQALETCLAALATLEYPHEAFEVLVIDDGSAKPVEQAMRCWTSRLPLRVLRQDNAGPASARNRGGAHARGDWLVFLDDDCAPLPNWLRAFSGARPNQEEMLGGGTINALPRNRCAEASTVLVDYVCEYFLKASSPMRFLPSNNLVVSTKRFQELGGFDMSFPLAGGEDREFCYRWLQSGGRLRRAPNAVVEHAHRLNPSSFLAPALSLWPWRLPLPCTRAAAKSNKRPARVLRLLHRTPVLAMARCTDWNCLGGCNATGHLTSRYDGGVHLRKRAHSGGLPDVARGAGSAILRGAVGSQHHRRGLYMCRDRRCRALSPLTCECRRHTAAGWQCRRGPGHRPLGIA